MMLYTKLETKPTILSETIGLPHCFEMKFNLATVPHGNFFTATDEAWVEVAGIRHTGSLVMAADLAPQPWVPSFEGLSPQDFAGLLEFNPEIIVFGSGRTFRMLHPRLIEPLMSARVGIEAMDTRAACRTYNVLISEGRRALIALIQRTDQ